MDFKIFLIFLCLWSSVRCEAKPDESAEAKPEPGSHEKKSEDSKEGMGGQGYFGYGSGRGYGPGYGQGQGWGQGRNYGNQGWGNNGWGNNNGWGQQGQGNFYNPQQVQYNDEYQNKGQFGNQYGGFNIGCERDIYFGDQKWSIKGREYCENLDCRYNGQETKTSSKQTALQSYCTAVRMTNVSVDWRVYDVTYNIFCRCPEVGHSSLPICEKTVPVHFHLIPKKTSMDCVSNFDQCAEGKFCMMANKESTCPTSCKLETDTESGSTTIRANYDCCVQL